MKNKVFNLKKLSNIISNKKKTGKKVVHCHGVFDLLHIGHINHFKSCKTNGDILIVTLTADNFVKKGPNRPFFNEDIRSQAIASLEVVDYVVIFDEDTPYELIKSIQPHILVKGADYIGKEVVGQDIADELKLVEFLDGKSSTKIIEKIKR